MTANELFKAGNLPEAIKSLGLEVRDHPTDSRRRTFLFELLCFAGEYDRAEKHLNVLAQASPDAQVGALLYRAALHAERRRQALFGEAASDASPGASSSRGGTINGRRFQTLEDADPRVGGRLEAFVAGEHVLISFDYIGSLRMEPPKKLRDLLWPTAMVTTSSSFKGQPLGEVLLPALAAHSYKHADGNVQLGRATEWQELDGIGPVPVGQKLLVVDGEDVIPFLEVRELVFDAAEEPLSDSPGSNEETPGESE